MIRRPALLSTLLVSAAGAVFLLALTALGFGLWTVTALRAEADARQSAAAADNGKALELQQNASLATHTAQARAELAERAIAPGGDAAFISQIEALAAQEHLYVDVSSVQAVAPAGSAPGSLALTLALQGSYEACLRYVQLLETSAAASEVPALSLSYDDTARSWKGTMTLVVLSFDSP